MYQLLIFALFAEGQHPAVTTEVTELASVTV